MKLILISDTHAYHQHLQIPDGDVLIHAGDLTRIGELKDVVAFNDFLGTLPHPHKIVIAGNHDFCFERKPDEASPLLTNTIYLQDSEVTINGVKFYGSPWQPWFYDWAFNLRRGAEIREKWDLIPSDTGVLITHGPPFGYLDKTSRGDHAGCEELLKAITRIRPKLHVFGHIHEGYGVIEGQHTTFVNASICTLDYDPTNPPIEYNWSQGQ
ncbi:MAG: metallophosphatase domain-containing protein [Chloroflexi bacterium]|nr:metallophosphatase domain-containing protein [Chloroflexota bacterium]